MLTGWDGNARNTEKSRLLNLPGRSMSTSNQVPDDVLQDAPMIEIGQLNLHMEATET